MSKAPSVGDIVHYLPTGTHVSSPRAAIVTEVDDPGVRDSSVRLCVFNAGGLAFYRIVPRCDHDETGERIIAGGTWDWPNYRTEIEHHDHTT